MTALGTNTVVETQFDVASKFAPNSTAPPTAQSVASMLPLRCGLLVGAKSSANSRSVILAAGSRLFGVIDYPVESVLCTDAKNEQEYRLGWYFPTDAEKVDWTGQARSNTPRSELVAELAELHNLQCKSMADATFVGWTRDHMIDYQKRSDRISAVQRELDALDGTSDWSRPLWPLAYMPEK